MPVCFACQCLAWPCLASKCSMSLIQIACQQLSHCVQDTTRAALLCRWWHTLSQQSIAIATKSKRPQQLAGLCSALEITVFQQHVEDIFEAQLERDVTGRPGRMFRLDTITSCRDAALFGLAWGYAAPARLSILRSLLHPDFVKPGCCTDEVHQLDGSGRECAGNRLEYIDPGKTRLRAAYVHHKTTYHGPCSPVEFELPEKLNKIMLHWVKEGHAAAQEGRAVRQQLLFFNISQSPRHTGTPLTGALLSQWWQRLLAAHGGSAAAQPVRESGLTLRDMRHVFVTERRSLTAAAGMPDEVSAALMGHTLPR